MKLRAMLLAFALAACGQAGQQAKQDDPNAPADPFELNIEIGRYGVMLSQIHSLTGDRPGTALAAIGLGATRRRRPGRSSAAAWQVESWRRAAACWAVGNSGTAWVDTRPAR